ncbi:hypothetical protein K9M74_01455 [Candidatus Woesearchaeota archaeon]|nr:hypothetical protein [Candidatus Woesearchaeota archaeon]
MVAQGLIDSLTALGKAVGFLFKGDFGAMAENLLIGGIAVGVFLIIMFLMKVILEISILKSPEHKKYATWIGVGIALIGMVNDAVYNMLTSLVGGSFIIVVLILLVVFAVVIFVNRMRKSHYDASAEMHGAHTDAISARKDLKKEDHELSLQEKLEKRETGALNKAEHIVDDELSSIRNLQELVTKMRQLLGQLAQTTDQAHAQQLRGSLTRGAQALPTLVKEDFADEEKLKKILHQLEHEFLSEIKLDGEETEQVAHLEARIKDQLVNEHKVGEHAARTKILTAEQQLKDFLQQARQLDQQREELVRSLRDLEGKELTQTKQLQQEVTQLIQSLDAGNSSLALQHVGTIEQLINAETAESRQVRQLLMQEQQLTQRKLQLDHAMKQLVHRLAGVERREDKTIRHDEHAAESDMNKGKKLVSEILGDKNHLRKERTTSGKYKIQGNIDTNMKELQDLINRVHGKSPLEATELRTMARNAGIQVK